MDQQMTAATWITMLAMMLFVWGGCAITILTAVRKESGKAPSERA